MDGTRFDALARLLGSVATRRGGLRALAGVAFAAPAADVFAKGRKEGGKDRHPGAQGPCKTTKRPTNLCTSDKECCTNICDMTKGQKNKDKLGRCRCVNRNQPCQEDRNCCSRKNQKMRCIQGRCQAVVPVAKPCKTGDRCASPAICVAYTDGNPAGTFCLIELNGPCTYDGQCVSESCVNGVCQARAQLAEPCGDSNAGATCATYGATCTTYTYTDPPAGTFCLLPDNVNKTVSTRCTANDQCRSGQCAMVNGEGQCAPVACSVCNPYDGVSACPYDSIQGYIDDNGDGGDLQVFEGQYAGQIFFTDADWHLFPCCDDCFPEISPADGDSYGMALDVNAAPSKNITVERMTLSNFAGTPAEHLIQIWGKEDTGGGIPGSHDFLILLLDRIKTNLKDSSKNYIRCDSAVILEIRDSVTKGLFVWSEPAQKTRNFVTLTRSTLEGFGPSAAQDGAGVYGETTQVNMAGSTIKNFKRGGAAAGVWLASPNNDYKSGLSMDGSSLITANTVGGTDAYGWGVYAPDGSVLSGVTPAKVTGNGTGGLKQCATNSTTACPGF